MAKQRTYEGVFNALQQISKDENIDFGLDGYTAETFKQKYFTGPGNIENLYNKLNKITEAENIDFGQGTSEEWLASFGYKRDGDTFRTLDNKRVGSHDETIRKVPKPQQPAQPQQKPVQAKLSPAAITAPTPEVEAPEDPVLGTPWGTEGSATGKSKKYQGFAPGQVRETGDPGTPDYGIPYRPYTQMSAAARHEIERENDFTVRQLKKMQQEKQRRTQPLVDTGSPEANKNIIKTQGQWDDELQQGVKRISNSVVVPAVDKAIAEFDKKAHEVFESTQEGGNAKGGLPTGTASGATIFGSMRESNQAKDPEKILEYLNKQMEGIYKNETFLKQVSEEANRMGIDGAEYIENIIKPQIAADIQSRFDQTMIARELPKSGKEYVVSGLSNSIVGMLADAFLETKSQRYYKNQAEAMTEEGGNPYYNPSTSASLAKMGVSFAADAPFFGVYGRVSGQVAKQVAEREIKSLVAKGMSETAARNVVGTALENSVGARMKNYLMQHVIGGSLTMGAYNATSEAARQARDKEGVDLARLAGSTAEGLAVGAAFGATGAATQALSQPLSGFSKLGAKAAGFGAEAETMYTTEELTKMLHGEDAFENPFEGSLEALEKLGVMKLSGGHLLESAGKKLIRAKEVGGKQVAQETLAQMLGQNRTGIKFTDEEQAYVRNSQEGQKLIDGLSQMHPGKAITEVNGKKKLTKEGEALRVQLSQNYEDFMNNKDIPANVKQKVAGVLGGIYRPGLETGADIIQNEDGSVLVKTRDKDGNCVQDLSFDNLAEAEQWRDSHLSECRRNDAVNMWNSASDQTRQEIVNIVRDNVSGKAILDEMKSKAEGMKQNRLKRQLEKINQIAEQYEGRELTDEEARNFIQMVIRDGDEATFGEIYQLIHDMAYPEDMPDVKRNYWEGQQLSAMEKHFAHADAQLAEERLMLQGEDFAKEVMDDAQYPDEKISELAARLSRGYITKDQFDAAVDYYNKMSKVNGMFDETLKDIDNQVEAANSYVRKNTHADSGSLIDAVYAQKPDRQYYVTAGHFEVTPDGKLKPTDNSGMVILRDKETGEIEVVSPSEITVSHIDDPNRVIAENESMEGLRGQLMKEADDVIDLHPDTPTEAMNGDIYTGADGNQYMVMQIQDEAGNPVGVKIAIDETGNPVGNPMPFDMEEYRKAKSNEIDAAERPQEETVLPEDNQVTTEPQPLEEPAAEAAVGAPEQETKPAGGEASVEKDTGVNEPSAAVSLKVPVDENGKKLYEQAKPEDALADLTAEFGEEDAQQMITQMVENTDKALKALQEQDTSDMTDMNDIRSHMEKIKELQKKRDFWQSLIKNSTEADEQKIEAGQSVDIQHPSGESGGNREDGQDKIQAQSTERQAGADTQQQQTEGSKDDTGVAPVPDTDVSGGTRVEQQPEEPTAEQKVAQATVEKNIGKRYEFMNQDGTRSELVIDGFKGDDMVPVTRQDYDANGKSIGEPYSQDLKYVDVGNSIINGFLKPSLSVEDRLRKAYKNKVGMQNVIDVLSEKEQQQLLEATENGDYDALNDLTNDLVESHREDIILNEREKRNANVRRIMEGNGSREEKLRKVRKEYQGYDDAVIALSDEAMQPSTIEEYVANLHSRQPKSGEGPLAYFSYDVDGRRIVGMQDETGFGTKTGGDANGFKPWLDPKGKGMSLQKYSETIHSQLPEAIKEQYSDQDVRNAILSVFGGAERPSDITTMVIKRGIIQAEQAARRMEEMWIDGPSFQKVVEDNSFTNRLKRGKESVNTEPTEGQKQAGNYKKGHISFGGYDFTIENPEGSMRRGTDATGRKWEQKMNNTYGYILGKFGKDGDHLDMFINDAADLDNWNGTVYVVDQVDPKTGKWDEHKVLYGFDSLADAKKAYLSNYEEGWKGLGKITGVTKEGFDKWLDSSKRKLKQFADHSIAKEHMVESEHTGFDSSLKQLNTKGISINDPELMKEYGLKDITLSKTGDHVTLNKIVVENQGEGNGTRFMEDLARLADEKGWTLALTPSGGFGAKSIKRLKDFYKRFGFADNKGRNADFYTRESMIRRPKETVGANTPERQEQALRDAVVEHLRSKGIEVSTDWKLGQKILDDYNSRTANREDAEDYEVKPQKVTDQQTLDELNKGKTVKRYRAMQLIDGKLYPPMSAKVDGEMRQPTEIGVWEQSEERPDLIKNGKFVLNKGQKGQGSVPAAYNPYFHTSTSGLNDQFTSAYKRPELVVVEVDIPESELTSGYKAEGAKDAVGNVEWHSGVVNGQLPADRQRQVTLSRYNRVNRVVPDSEVADMIAKQLEGTNVEVPYNVVTPQLRKELEARGVKVSDKPAGSVTEDINGNPIEKGAKYFKTGDGHAYGYTMGGKIYVDPRIATSETPIHEYGHLYCAMKRQTDPEGWNDWKQVMFGDKLVQPIIDKVRRDYPELSKEGKEDDFAEEIITQFSGKRGSERLREIAEEVAKEKGGVFGKAEAITAMQRLKSILNRFWEGIAKMMGWKYTNANQIADRIMADMLNGVDPTKMAKDASRLRPQAEIERTLMGVHNLSEYKLRKVLKQGGLANPSLAVIDTNNHMHTDYGDISLIPKSGLIDARTGRNAGTFTADAWTPTYPTVKKRMSSKGQSKFWKDIRSLNEDAGEVASYMRMAFDTWLDHETGQERLAYWYMKEKGMNPELVLNKNPYGEDIVKRIDELTDDGNLEVSRLPEEQIKEIADMYHAYKESKGEPVTPAEERIAKLQERIDPNKQSPFTKLQQFRLDELKKYGELLHNLNDFVYAVGRSAFSDGKPNVNATIDKATKALKEQNLEQDFDKWLQDKADSYGIEEWLYSGTDDRTGEQKWVRNTLQNASKLMKKQGLNGAVGWSSLGNWIATVANKEKTLGGIRKYRKNLATTEEQHDTWKENWGNRLYPIVEKLGGGDVFHGDNVMADILEHGDYAGYYKREYGKELSKEDRATIDEFIKEVRTNFPTGYFETKFERPVMLDEFEIAVVPENTSPDIVEALKNAGLDVRTYDNTGAEDQKDANRKQAAMEAVQGRDDIMFQMVGREGAAEADRAEGGNERSRNLTLAEDSEKAGVDAKAIKLATGWERGADGQWRYEIPDADVDILSKYKAKVDEMKKEGVEKPQPIIKLEDLLGEDNELFKYYPELKKMDVLFSNMLPDGVAGKFDGKNIELNAKETGRFDVDELNNENVCGTLLHEVQHAIQDIEGFAQGGNLQTSTTEAGINAIIEKKNRQKAMLKQQLDANRKILNNPEELKAAAELENKSEKEVKDNLLETINTQAAEYDTIDLQIARLRHTKAPSMTDAKDLYHRLAGEVESRNVTERMGMTDEQRRQSLASDTEDVPRKDQVIIIGDGTAMNIDDIKPVGENRFGGVYDQFKGKVKEAFDFLTKKKDGYLKGVFHRDDLGDIDLAWGSAPTDYTGKGLAHIIRKHINVLKDFNDIDEAMQIIDDVVTNGVSKSNSDPKLVNIEKGDYRVVVAKNEEGNWILSAFDFVKPKKEKGKTLPPSKTPGQSDVEAGAVTSNPPLSEGKDTKNSNTLQENTGKSAIGPQENENNSLKFQKVEDDTHSENFKDFFGDWEKDPEKASKIVDKDGKPMVVYHQTANDFTVFDPRHKGAGTNDYQLPFGIFMKPTAQNIGLGGEKQIPLYANIRKPLRVENRQVLSSLLKSKVEGYKEALAEYKNIDQEYSKKFDEAMKFDHERAVENWNKWKAGEMTEQEYQDAISDTAEDVVNEWKEAQNKPISEMKELLDNYFRNSEYDGIWIAKDEGSMGRSTETIIAFEPNQVKSATNNTGAYDPNNPDIRFQKVDKPIFVSNAERAVDGIKQDKATPEQWLKMIEKGGGLKAGEDKWIGLSDWLNSQKDKKSLTKQEVMDYIRQNQIDIEDWNYEEFSYRHNDKLKEFNDEFRDLMAEGEEETGSVYTADHADWAFNQMKDKYGDDFEYAFDIQKNGDRWELIPTLDWNDELSGEAKYYLGAENTINPTRMEYTTQGLDNKREIALVVPSIESYNSGDQIHFGDAGDGRAVAWVRFGDTTDADGNKVLVIDEIQSKRHQDARELGYQGEFDNSPKKQYEKAYDRLQEYRQDLEKKYGEYFVEDQLTDEERTKYNEMYKEVVALSEAKDDKVYSVPDAPFEKNWHELAMKRMLRYAAENGYDKIAWTTGAQQAERYNMSKSVDEINTTRLYDGRYEVEGVKDGERIFGDYYPASKLPEMVGKDLADKIIKGEDNQSFKGDDLRVGGHGMEGFYDQILPRFMDKYGKKWGVKTGEVELPDLERSARKMHSIDVTPDMKESVMQGQPMFQRVGGPESEMTPEDRQYWNKWDDAMKKWKERNAIPADQTQAPEKPKYQQGENALDYAQRLVQWNRMKSLWQTAPKLEDYRQVRDDRDIVEAARQNEQRYPDSPSAKMRRVASDMMRIRHAMSRQKAYDKATVKAVTDFAQDFMKLGFGDNLSRGEMERMLSSVKNATGAKDIKKNVDNIMNILIDNHLRNLDQRVQKLSSTKELSKTAQGVEKQGRLELKGQRMIQAFRDAREKRMTLDQINERMAEVAEKMNRSDDEAPMWEQEYEGLSIARQYVENIEGSREEWADLDTLYKDAVKDYKTSGRSYKDQQEYLESLEQAIQENKIERIGYFGDIIGRLEGNIAESMQGAKEFVEREKQRVKHIQDIANFDLAGKDMGAMREKIKGKPANFFLQPLGTFEQMLKQFGSRNANGEGYLYDYFMRNWMDATDKAFINEQKAKEELDAKAREVFGGKVKRWSDLYDISRSLPTMDVEVLDGEEPKTFKLTQGNLLYIYMADKMTDGRMKLRKMGIDEEAVNQIKDFLDPRLKELGDWLQNEYLPSKRTEYNKVHERMFGAPMAAIDNYFPLKVLGDARYQEQDVNVPDSETLPSTITGNIIKRRKNALPLDILHTDALSLAIEHVEDMERWAAQAEWNKDINTLLSYTTFRNKVKNMDTIYGSGDALWNSFKDAAKMAAGTYNPSVKPGHVDAAISNIAKGVTAAKINFRVYTAFKQLLSAPAFLHDVNLADFAHDAVNPYGSWKWAMENMPVFQKRWKSRQVGDTRLMDDPTDWKLWKTNIVQMATRLGMSPNALVDGVTCAVGARSIYKSRYKKYKEIGASDEVAHKRALQDAEIGYNLTQQSSEGAFVSAIQKDRTVAANMLSVFRNSSMAYTRQWVDAARNLKKRSQKGYKEDSIKFMARQMQDQFGLDEAQAKRAAELEYAREGRRDVARLLNMMFGVTVAWNLGSSLPYLLIGDDDNTKKEMLTDALMKGLLAGPTEGLAAGNLYSDFIGRTLANEQTRNTFKEEGIGAALDNALKQGGDYEVNPLPLMADLQGMIKKMGYDKYAAAQDVFNIVMQSAVGVNPQTFTDMWNAIMDYTAPGWDGTSYTWKPENMANSKELALFMMRLMNAPTSSWRNKYIDELGMNAEDAKKLPYEEMARRYAHYKHWKDAPIMGWLRGEEARNEKVDKMQKQFDDAVSERMGRLTDDELMHNVARSESAEEKRRYAKMIAQRLGLEPGEDSQKADEKKNWYQNLYQQKMLYEDIKEDEMLADKYKNLENTFKEKREEAERKSVQDLKEFNEANKEWKDRIAEAKKEAKKRMDWIRGGKYDTPSGKKGNSKKANLLAPGKKQLENSEDAEAIMKNIRQWRKEALEYLMRAEK